MPVSVPTYEELTQALQTVNNRLSALESRVTVLEEAEEPTPDEEPAPTPSQTLVGAGIGWQTGAASWGALINDFIDLSGRQLQVRRIFEPGMPASYRNTGLRHDNGVRDQVWSFKPSTSTTVSQIVSLFQSIPNRSRVWVTPYHEPRDNMTASAYHTLYNKVYEAYQEVGGFAGIGPTLTNWGVNHQNELSYVQPTKATFLAVDHYAQLEGTLGQAPAVTMKRAIDYANANGLEFGVGEFGVDINRSGSINELTTWMRGFSAVDARWLCYFHANVNGSWWLDNEDAFITAYQYLWDYFN